MLEEERLIAALQRYTPRLQVVQGLGGLGVRQQAELVGSHQLLLGLVDLDPAVVAAAGADFIVNGALPRDLQVAC